MNWTKMSAIAEILSSVAILITLIYLAIEIGQNTAILQASAREAALASTGESLSQVIETPELWLNLSNPDMTDAEKAQLSAFLIYAVARRENAWLQYQADALDETGWQTSQSGLIDLLSYSESRKWWDFYDSNSEFERSFADNVNQQLAATPIKSQLTDVQAFE